MAKFKKIIPALCMLVVSAIMAVSTTYAWFSMNNTVKATGLEVTAKSNATYLLIGAADNATDKTQSDLTKEAAFVSGGTNEAGESGTPAANSDKKVYPIYYADKAGTMPGTAAAGASLTVEANKWYTARNNNSNNATDATSGVVAVADGDLVKYVVTYKVWLTLSADSENLSKKIKVTSTLGENSDAATSVVVKIGSTSSETLKLTNGTASITTSTYALSASTSVPVELYVYIDGTSTNVNSNYYNENATKLAGELSITFEVVD